MGVAYGGDRGTSPPEFGAGDANTNCLPPRFCHIGTKMSILWPYAKICFWPGMCPGPRWESSRRSLKPLSRLERGHPSPYLTPLGTNPPSALAMRPPRSPARSTTMDVDHIGSDTFTHRNFFFIAYWCLHYRPTYLKTTWVYSGIVRVAPKS